MFYKKGNFSHYFTHLVATYNLHYRSWNFVCEKMGLVPLMIENICDGEFFPHWRISFYDWDTGRYRTAVKDLNWAARVTGHYHLYTAECRSGGWCRYKPSFIATGLGLVVDGWVGGEGRLGEVRVSYKTKQFGGTKRKTIKKTRFKKPAKQN